MRGRRSHALRTAIQLRRGVHRALDLEAASTLSRETRALILRADEALCELSPADFGRYARWARPYFPVMQEAN